MARTAVQYTSPRDIIPEHLMTPPIVSPSNSSSWNEIPIKNPLVKQAALAYVQASPTPHVAKKGLFRMFKDKDFCTSRTECLNGVISKAITEFFVRFYSIRAMDRSDDDDDEEEGGGGTLTERRTRDPKLLSRNSFGQSQL